MLGKIFGAWAGNKIAGNDGRPGNEGRGALLGAALASSRFRKYGVAALALTGGYRLLKRYRRGKQRTSY